MFRLRNTKYDAMKISLIAAIGRNHEIGKDNDLLWHLPADMAFFKNTTLHHFVIMGRLSYESIPARYRPFADRSNVVISRNKAYEAPGCFLADNLHHALQIARENQETEAFIIGGAQIYTLALNQEVIDTMYITRVDASFPDAQAFFPTFEMSEWKRTELFHHDADAKHAHTFTAYRYDRE